MTKTASYHIYLEDRCLFKNLNEEEFDLIWDKILPKAERFSYIPHQLLQTKDDRLFLLATELKELKAFVVFVGGTSEFVCFQICKKPLATSDRARCDTAA